MPPCSSSPVVANRLALDPSSFCKIVVLTPNEAKRFDTHLMSSIFGDLLIVGKLISFSKISKDDKLLLTVWYPNILHISRIIKKLFSLTIAMPISSFIIIYPGPF